MYSQTAVHYGLPGIDARTIGAVVIRLEPFAGQQLRVRDDEVQLQPPLVLVLNPQHAVLIFVEPGHQNPLEARHQFFTLAGRQILFRKGQDAGGVLFGVGRGVNKLPDFLRLPLQNAGAVALPVFTQQIIHRTGAAAAPSGMKLNDHRLPPFPALPGEAVRVRHRWPSVRRPPVRGRARYRHRR